MRCGAVSIVAAYARERFTPSVFGPVVLFLAGAAVWTVPVTGTADLLRAAGLVVCLVAQLRLWDDIEDVERDRCGYPDRVLVNARRGPFVGLMAALIVLTAGLCAKAPASLAAYALLLALSWSAYRAVRPQVADGMWRFAILPLKYPAIAGVTALSIGGVDRPRLAFAATAAYSCAAAYEAWHSPTTGASS
jgi:hypothetical protein